MTHPISPPRVQRCDLADQRRVDAAVRHLTERRQITDLSTATVVQPTLAAANADRAAPATGHIHVEHLRVVFGNGVDATLAVDDASIEEDQASAVCAHRAFAYFRGIFFRPGFLQEGSIFLGKGASSKSGAIQGCC